MVIQAYTYDELNRLATAEETKNSSQEWKQTFVYDRYGNRNFNTTSNNITTLPSGFDPDIYNPTISTTNNRFSSGQGYSYDSSGNTTADAEGRTFVYDAENKQIEVIENSATIGEYFYDGDGRWVKKVVPGGETTVFVYDAGGKLIGEYSTVVQPVQDAKTVYTTNDHLGSPRINTDATGQVISRHDYHPFGEEIARTGYGPDTIRKQFAGYERDGETGLDFAQARNYSSCLGRFVQVDPYSVLLDAQTARVQERDRIIIAYFSQAQNWNQYSYSLNNPYRYNDPTGEKPKVINVFIGLKAGEETEAGKREFDKVIAQAKEWGVEVRIHRFEDGTATKSEFLKSLSTKDIATVFVGHSVELSALMLSGGEVSSRDLRNKVTNNSVVAIFACDTADTFDNLYSNRRTTFVETDTGRNAFSLVDADYNAAQNFVFELARTGSNYEAYDLARRGVEVFRNAEEPDDTVTMRTLPTPPSPTSRRGQGNIPLSPRSGKPKP